MSKLAVFIFTLKMTRYEPSNKAHFWTEKQSWADILPFVVAKTAFFDGRFLKHFIETFNAFFGH